MNRLCWITVFFLFFAAPAYAKLSVGATTTDLEALTRAVAGDRATAFSVAKGTQDPHQIEAKPSYMVKFREADLIVSHGLDLEVAWLEPLIQGARNSKIKRGAPGFLELGPLLEPIEVAKQDLSRAEGDVHPNGNPHFQLDPLRLGRAAVSLAKRLGELDAANESGYRAAAESFQKSMTGKTKSWKDRLAKTGFTEFVSYHKTFSYLADRFGLKNELQLEPKPGIPPTAAHILKIISEMRARKIRLVLIENYFDDSVRAKLEKEIPGVKVLKLPVSVGGEETIATNEQLIERIVSAIEGAAK